jgi:hypothetical protein
MTNERAGTAFALRGVGFGAVTAGGGALADLFRHNVWANLNLIDIEAGQFIEGEA